MNKKKTAEDYISSDPRVQILEKGSKNNQLLGKGYEFTYNLKNASNPSSFSGLFNNFTKFIFTDKVEIKKPS